MSTFIRILTIGLLVVGTIAATARTVTVLHNNQVVRDEIALQQSLDAPISSDASSGAQDTSILSQVGSHATAANCWVIVSGKVYDVTKLLNTHSGGAGAITPFCGKDATQQFTTKGGGGSHSQNAHNVLTTYYIAPAGGTGGSVGQKTPSASTQSATGLRSGSSIQVSNAGMLNVRKTANGSLVGQQKPGAIGKIIGGPVTLGGYTWWNIDFGSGVDGWGAQAFLQNPGQSTSVAPTTPATSPVSTPAGATYTTVQVATHSTSGNCYVIISGKVYNVTRLISSHSGGAGAITPFCGKDATVQFQTKGGGGSHSTGAYNTLATYFVGVIAAPLVSDTTIPSTPTNLTASAISDKQTNLSWSASTDNVGVTGYKIFRGNTQVGTTPALAYTDSGLSATTLYSYTVQAYDAAGNVSAKSSARSVTTLAAAVVPPPGTTLTAADVSAHASTGSCYLIISGKVYDVTRLINSHSGGADKITPFCGRDATVQFTTKGGNGTHTASSYNTLSTYFIGDLSSLVPDTISPSVPSSLVATAPTDTQVSITWTASSDNVGVTGYKIFRGGAQVGTSMAPAYTDTGRTANTTYSYTVQAYDAAGNVSAQSTAKSVTTPAATVVPPPGTTFTLSQVITHSSSGDCWVIISNKVYNVTGLLSTHSGGGPAIIPACGTEATQFFTTKNGNGSHLQSSVNTLTTYFVGDYAATQSTFTLGVTKAGTGSGTVTSSGGSINCGSACSITATAGLPATLTASPAAGSIFGGWSGVSGCTSSVTCTFTLSANTSLTATFTLSTDTTAPTVPTGLTASAISSSAVSLSWSASTDAIGVTGYNVYRGGTKITTVTGTSYTDSGLSASTAYSYTVSAYDAAGNTSAQTAAKSATTPSASAGTITTADVATHAASNNCWVIISNKVYNVTARVNTHTGGSGAITPFCGKDATVQFLTKGGGGSHQQSSLTTLATYFVGDLGAVVVPPTTGDTTPPTVPTGLNGTALSATSVSLSWTASTDTNGVAGYMIYRGGTSIGTSVSTTYTDTGLSPTTAYSYTVSAYDGSSNSSAQTAAKSVTTQATTVIYTAADVAQHNVRANCWIIISNKVYNVTTFIAGNNPPHPGNSGPVIPYCGRDATLAFTSDSVGHKHDSRGYNLLPSYNVGDMDPSYTGPPVPTTSTVNVTSAGVFDVSSMNIHPGDSVRFVYTPPISGSITIDFSPSSVTSTTLSSTRTSRTKTFNSAGTWTVTNSVSGNQLTITVQ